MKRGDKCDFSIYYVCKNITRSNRKNKFEISGMAWDKELKLLDESYFASDIQGYFECISKKYKIRTD